MFGFTKCAVRYCGANFITTPDPRKKVCRQCYNRLKAEQEHEQHRWMNPTQRRDDDDNVFVVPVILHGDSIQPHRDIQEDSRDFFQAGKSGGGGAAASFEEDREERNSSPPSDDNDSYESGDSGGSDSCDSGGGD